MAATEPDSSETPPALDSDKHVAGIACTVREVEHCVGARSSLTLPIRVPPRCRMSMVFRTAANDIAFGAFSRRKADGVTRELQAANRVNSHLVPQFFQLITTDSAETVALHFENSYSLLTAKNLLLRLCVEPAHAQSLAHVVLVRTRVGFAQLRGFRAASGTIQAGLASGGTGFFHELNCQIVLPRVFSSVYDARIAEKCWTIAIDTQQGLERTELQDLACGMVAASGGLGLPELGPASLPSASEKPDSGSGTVAVTLSLTSQAVQTSQVLAFSTANALASVTGRALDALTAPSSSSTMHTLISWLDRLNSGPLVTDGLQAAALALVHRVSPIILRRYVEVMSWDSDMAAVALCMTAQWRAAQRLSSLTLSSVSQGLSAMPCFSPGRDRHGRLVLVVRFRHHASEAGPNHGTHAGEERLRALNFALEAACGAALYEATLDRRATATAVLRQRAVSDSSAAVSDSSAAVSDSSAAVSDSSAAVSDSSAAVSDSSAAVSDDAMPGAINLVVDFTGCSSSDIPNVFLQRAAATLVLHFPGAIASCCLIAAPASVRALWSSIAVTMPQWMAAGVHMLDPADSESGIAALRDRFPERTVREILHEYPDCASLTRLVRLSPDSGDLVPPSWDKATILALNATSLLGYDWCPHACTGIASAWGIAHEDAIITGSVAGAIATATALADDDAERHRVSHPGQVPASAPSSSSDTSPSDADASILAAIATCEHESSEAFAEPWLAPGLVVKGQSSTLNEATPAAAGAAVASPGTNIATSASDTVEVVEWGTEDMPRARSESHQSGAEQHPVEASGESHTPSAGGMSDADADADDEESIMI